MALYLIGLGLGDEKDVTVRGQEVIRSADVIFLEAYTSILCISKDRLEEMYGKTIQLAHRETVESEADKILDPAAEGKIVAFLVVGDPFGATTHTDLLLRAKKRNIQTHVVHNASIMNAAGACGLQLYTFGQTVSIPFFRPEWRPDSWYDKVLFNFSGGLHTLCLLDIKVREPDFDELVKSGRTRFLPPRYMTVNTAVQQILEISEKRNCSVCGPETIGIGLARVGQSDQKIVAAPLKDLVKVDFGAPLHSLVLVGGSLHDLEQEMIDLYSWDGQGPFYAEPKEEDTCSGSSDSDSDA